MTTEFKNKKILITGGSGSIGSAIARELLKHQPRQIRLFSHDMTRQSELSQQFGHHPSIRFLVGDIRDEDRLDMAMENIDIVFHTAALKHVDACERNPFEAIKTNVQGTQNVIDCALENNVKKVISISTDKAIEPTSVMGCTKLLAEKLIRATFLYGGDKKTKFCSVRFGNVLGSYGSVVPLLLQQVKNGKPLTITDPEMTRFFISISQAVNLLFKATTLMRGGEIFVLKMPSANLKDLIQAIGEVAIERKYTKKVNTKVIGRKEGEKMHEKLLAVEEPESTLETEDMFIILPTIVGGIEEFKHYLYPGAKKTAAINYNSQDQRKLTLNDLKKLINDTLDH